MPGPHSDDEFELEFEFDPEFLRSRREAWWIGGAWALALIWTLGYGMLFAYHLEAEEITTTCGMPSWIFWGVALPWLLVTVFSIWFARFVIRDHALDVVAGEGDRDTSEENRG